MPGRASESEESARLAALYDTYHDDYLLQIASTELTPIARRVIDQEIQKRNLTPQPAEAEPDEQPLLPVWEGESLEEAQLATQVLMASGITAFLAPKRRNSSAPLYQVVVHAGDTEKAQSILADQPIEELAHELVTSLASTSFVSPACPHCGSEHTLLLSAEDVNTWRCDDCNHTWVENPSETRIDSPASSTADADADANGAAKRQIMANRIAVTFVFCTVLFVTAKTWPEQWLLLQKIGFALLIPALLLWAIARLQLGSSFSGSAEARSLVTHGLYSKFQNPIYVFGALGIAGMILYLNRPYALLIFLFLIPSQIIRVRRERRVLEEAFGDRYREYRKQTLF